MCDGVPILAQVRRALFANRVIMVLENYDARPIRPRKVREGLREIRKEQKEDEVAWSSTIVQSSLCAFLKIIASFLSREKQTKTATRKLYPRMKKLILFIYVSRTIPLSSAGSLEKASH